MHIIINHGRWAARAVTQAIHWLEGYRTVFGRFMEIAAECFHCLLSEGVGTDGLTRFGSTNLHNDFTGWLLTKVMVITNDTMHLSA
jgi:hypothetical protein